MNGAIRHVANRVAARQDGQVDVNIRNGADSSSVIDNTRQKLTEIKTSTSEQLNQLKHKAVASDADYVGTKAQELNTKISEVSSQVSEGFANIRQHMGLEPAFATVGGVPTRSGVDTSTLENLATKMDAISQRHRTAIEVLENRQAPELGGGSRDIEPPQMTPDVEESIKPQISKEEYTSLRKKTPSSAIRQKVNDVDGPKLDPVYGYPVETLEADHIVSMKEITEMDGFSDLSIDDKLEVLNLEDNL